MKRFSLLLVAATCFGQSTPDTFLRLRDTPSSYASQALKFVRVNAAANALEFTSASGGGATVFTGLGDVPASYAGAALKAVRVNAAANALEFYTPSGSSIATTDLTDVNSTPPSTNGQILIWDTGTSKYVPGDPIVSGPDAIGVAPTKNPVQIGAKFLTTPSTLTNNQVGSLQLDSTQNLLVKLQNSSVAVTGTFWQATQPVSGTFWQATQPISGTVTANAGTNLNTSALALDATLTGGTQKTKLVDTGGTNVASVSAANALKVDGSSVTQPVSGTFWQATQPVSGTFWQATQPISGTVTANDVPPTLTKGTQGSTGFSTQDLKDAGRTAVNYYATAAAAGTTGTETAITLTKASGTSATSTATSFVITSGKRYRIQQILVSAVGHATGTTQATTFAFRINTAGAVTTTSTPVVWKGRVQTPATSLAYQQISLPIPDGYEILGDGTLQFGMTANAVFTTNAPTWDVTIVGFEY